MGWAFNQVRSSPSRDIELLPEFPEIVIRGAAKLNPQLKKYYDGFPKGMHHYGGYYTMTEENWPIIGKTDVKGCFVAGAMSGFGTMAACAAGEICARQVLELSVPAFAHGLSLRRYDNAKLMSELRELSSRGIL